MLVRWALNGKPGKLLDPSYGGCAVLRVALEELTALGAPSAADMVHGADVDGSTASWAAHLVSQGVPQRNLLSADFLGLEPGRDLPRVSAVVGNPPYVRHHWIPDSTRRLAVDVAKSAGATQTPTPQS